MSLHDSVILHNVFLNYIRFGGHYLTVKYSWSLSGDVETVNQGLVQFYVIM